MQNYVPQAQNSGKDFPLHHQFKSNAMLQTLQQIFGQSLGLINRSSPTALQFLVQQLHFMSLIEQEPNFVDASPSERKSIGPINMDARGTPGA